MMTPQTVLDDDFSDLVALPDRAGPAPTLSEALPPQQLDQIAPHHLQERLAALMQTLPGVTIAPSRIGPVGSRAAWLTPANHLLARLERAQGRQFIIGGEFAHLHPPHDGSVHMALPDALVRTTVDAGWAMVRPLSKSFRSANVVMVFGPRDEHELGVAWRLLCASHVFAVRALSD